MTIQRATRTKSATGEVALTFREWRVAWASVTELSAAEQVLHGSVEARSQFLVELRWTGMDPDEGDRLVLADGRTLNVDGVIDPDQSRRTLQLTCTLVKDR